MSSMNTWSLPPRRGGSDQVVQEFGLGGEVRQEWSDEGISGDVGLSAHGFTQVNLTLAASLTSYKNRLRVRRGAGKSYGRCRCISTVSSVLPCFAPTPRSRPASVKPQRR